MQIVINISEDDYNNIKNYTGFLAYYEYLIKNGIPLPKGHGRLIDEKDLSLMTVHLIDGMLVCDAPTIIEADRSEEV